MTKQTAIDDGPRRKGGYPYYVLRQCLRLGTAVKEHGGERAGVPKALVAHHLEMDHGAASFAQLVTSAKTFGIVDGTSELFLTDAGRKYFFPTTDSESRAAELSFLVHPPSFATLVDELDGSRLPSTSMLANLLGRKCGVPTSWRVRAAQIFVSAATDMGVLDQGGNLRYAAAKHMAGTEHGMAASPMRSAAHETIPPPSTQNPLPSGIAGSPISGGAENVWVYRDGTGTIRLETPTQLTYAMWDRLTKYVDILRPSNGPTEGKNDGT